MTVIVSRRVPQGKESEHERFNTKMTQKASTFPGYLGATMFRLASQEDPEY
ncbi:hypothetical protein [Marinobacter sp.]|uniref:hypothetical protein n=1 Tax=Marinobacter sp. TaxID=50741 RepID=UPI002604FD59|nr:hypothetical protein [Marinobacter sp.]